MSMMSVFVFMLLMFAAFIHKDLRGARHLPGGFDALLDVHRDLGDVAQLVLMIAGIVSAVALFFLLIGLLLVGSGSEQPSTPAAITALLVSLLSLAFLGAVCRTMFDRWFELGACLALPFFLFGQFYWIANPNTPAFDTRLPINVLMLVAVCAGVFGMGRYINSQAHDAASNVSKLRHTG